MDPISEAVPQNLQSIFVATLMEGRLMFFSLDLPIQPIEFDESLETVKHKINVKYIGDILLHRNPIDSMMVDPKTYLCAASSKEEGLVVVIETKNIAKVSYLDEVSVEGSIVDVHIANKNLLILSTTPGCEDSYGDLITLIKIDLKKKTLTVANVFNLTTPCSGLVMSENGKYFFSMMLTNKHLGKFPLSEDQSCNEILRR